MIFLNNYFFAAENTKDRRLVKLFSISPRSSVYFSVVNFILLSALSGIFAFAQETGGVKGKVRTTSGDGIASVKVIVRQKGEDIKSATSDSNGKFVLENLKPGIYNIVFTKNGFASSLMSNIEVEKKKVKDLGDRLVLGVDQGTLVIVKGSVFDQNGHSVYGAKVVIERVSTDGQTRKVGSGTTSQSGEFTFRQSEGATKFRITATAKGISASKEITVDNAAIYRLAITLNVEK
jgi:hypothetical protein